MAGVRKGFDLAPLAKEIGAGGRIFPMPSLEQDRAVAPILEGKCEALGRGVLGAEEKAGFRQVGGEKSRARAEFLAETLADLFGIRFLKKMAFAGGEEHGIDDQGVCGILQTPQKPSQNFQRTEGTTLKDPRNRGRENDLLWPGEPFHGQESEMMKLAVGLKGETRDNRIGGDSKKFGYAQIKG
jgi:hypothetical protein